MENYGQRISGSYKYEESSETIKPPETIEDYKKIEMTILEFMGNPYCDHLMFDSLQIKLGKCRQELKKLREANGEFHKAIKSDIDFEQRFIDSIPNFDA